MTSKLQVEQQPPLKSANSEAAYWKQKYEETLAALKAERAAHIKTKDNLLKILGDTIAAKTQIFS